MRKAVVAAAAAGMVMATNAYQAPEPSSFTRVLAYVVTATGAVKAIIETYDWVRARWFPPPQQFNAGDLWHCHSCSFPPPGSAATPVDDSAGGDFITRQFPGRTWHVGQAIILCDQLQCFTFRYDGQQWFASGPPFKDPGAGYANAPLPPSNHSPGGGSESGRGSAPRGTTVSAPNVVYNPGSRMLTPSVTITPGGGGGGGGTSMPTWVEPE